LCIQIPKYSLQEGGGVQHTTSSPDREEQQEHWQDQTTTSPDLEEDRGAPGGAGHGGAPGGAGIPVAGARVVEVAPGGTIQAVHVDVSGGVRWTLSGAGHLAARAREGARGARAGMALSPWPCRRAMVLPCRRWSTRRMKTLSPGAAAARGRRVLLLTRSPPQPPRPIQDAPSPPKIAVWKEVL
jgi:hypothetical protein